MGLRHSEKTAGKGGRVINMQHFFVTPEQVEEEEITITGSDVNHIRNVLRMKKGEQLEISDGNNKKYLCEIREMTADTVQAGILEVYQTDTKKRQDGMDCAEGCGAWCIRDCSDGYPQGGRKA